MLNNTFSHSSVVKPVACATRFRNGSSQLLASAGNGNPAACYGDMNRSTCDAGVPVFEASTQSLEPASSPSRLMAHDPFLAQFSDANQYELSPLSCDEVGQWFVDEPNTCNGEPFSQQFTHCAYGETNPFITPDPTTITTTVYPQPTVKRLATSEDLIRNGAVTVVPALTAPRFDTKPLSPSPLMTTDQIKTEVDSDPEPDSDSNTEHSHPNINPSHSYNLKSRSRTPYLRPSSPLYDDDSKSGVRRGRPMKITSRSKQALYAREYRRKNKQALWEYEQRIQLQDREIARLQQHNKLMQTKLAKMSRMRAVIDQHCDNAGKANSNCGKKNSALDMTLSDIISRSLNQSSNEAKRTGLCVHVVGNAFTVLACDTCNASNGLNACSTMEKDLKKEVDLSGSSELFNGDFNEIKNFVR